MNTPELSAGRGGGLSQGLAANGPYKSLFRARSRSASHGSGNNNNHAAAAADAGLHVLAEAAQSPEALSPISTASPAPTTTPAPATITTATHAPTSVPTSKKRRKPSPLIAASSSPASSVAPLDSAVSALRPSPVVSSNAGVSSSSSYVMVDPSRPPRQPRAKSGGPGGGSTTGKGKRKERVPPPAPPAAAQANGNGEGEQRYERRSSQRLQSGSPFSAVELHHESESMAQGRSRNKQKNRAGSRDVGLPPPPPAPADDGNYDHAQSYYYETEPCAGAGNTVREGGQSLSPPQPKIWESPRPTPPVVDQYPTSARTTSKESSPAPVTDSGLQTPGIKPRMVTLLIEDRRLATDELVEVHVPLKTVGEGYLWADAKDVCAALQSGPSRIDGVFAFACAKVDQIDQSSLFRSREGVHYARKVSTNISACICRWRRDDSVGKLEG